MTSVDRTVPGSAGGRLPGHPRQQAVSRPTLGGPAFLRAHLLARVLGRVHPRLARPALERLWMTPWVHPMARRPIVDPSPELAPWSSDGAGVVMHGLAGGSGPTVVLVHGWAGQAADWRHLAADLVPAGWRVVAPDLPAHGATVGRTTTMFELGAALAAVLGDERPAAVVTHSLGFPALLRAVDLGAAPPGVIIALAPGRSLRAALQRFGERSALSPPLVAELDRAMRSRFGADVWHTFDVDRHLPHLAARGLVVHDTDDADISIEDGRYIAAHWPAASFTATRGLGHRRVLRDPDVRRLVVDTLADASIGRSIDPPTWVSRPNPGRRQSPARRRAPARRRRGDDVRRGLGPDDEPHRRRRRPQPGLQRRQADDQLQVLGDVQEVAGGHEDADQVHRQRRGEPPIREQPQVDHRVVQAQLPTDERRTDGHTDADHHDRR